MIFLIIPLVLSILYVFIWGWIKLVNFVFKPAKRREPKPENPYIQYHKAKRRNDEMYDEYLEWMSKNDPDIPVDKVKFKEDQGFDQEMKTVNRKWE